MRSMVFLVSKIKKEREDECVIRFLDGLNDEYETVKSGALVMDPILAVEKIFRIALKLKRKLNGSQGRNNGEIIQANAMQSITQVQNTDEENVVAAAGFNGSNNNAQKNKSGIGSKNTLKCTFCGKIGHTLDNCYKKHGYPAGWIPGFKNKGKQTPFNQGSNPSINQVGDLGLTGEQLQRLMSLLQNQGGQASSSTAATVLSTSSLKPDFKSNSDHSNEGGTWQDRWFC